MGDFDELSVESLGQSWGPWEEDPSESQPDTGQYESENKLYPIDRAKPCVALGNLRFMRSSSIEGGIGSGGQDYAALYAKLNENNAPWDEFKWGVHINLYRFRMTEVAEKLRDGEMVSGRVRIGVERTPVLQAVPADKLDVVLWDDAGGLLARVSASDWSASKIKGRIGDVAERALLWCGNGGYGGCMFLWLAVVWYTDLHPMPALEPISYSWQAWQGRGPSAAILRVEDKEALSDLRAGERFEVTVVPHFGAAPGLARKGTSHELARLPEPWAEAWSALSGTGYMAPIACFAHGNVPDDEGNLNTLMEVRCADPDKMTELAKFRRESGLDLRLDGDYEVMRLDPVVVPHAIPFGKIPVEFAAVPLKDRKNPLIELRMNGDVFDSARLGYRGSREKYRLYKKRLGKRSVWAALHYDPSDGDRPYLNVIWALGPNSGAAFVEKTPPAATNDEREPVEEEPESGAPRYFGNSAISRPMRKLFEKRGY